MMHRCSSSQGNMVGPCSCGLFHQHGQSNSSSTFSMLFSKPFDHHQCHYEPAADYHQYQYHHMHSFPSPANSSSTSVDCTLSLGTPSTRLCPDDDVAENRALHERRSDSRVSNFCWDLLQSKHSSSSAQTTSHKNGGRGSNNNSNGTNNDPLVARRCANCDTTSTPLWRNGPRGPKSLCNACGIRFKKEERRASAAAATSTGNGAVIEPGHMFGSQQYHNSPWNSFPHSQTQKMPCLSPANEFRFMDDHDNHHYESDTSISFLSWRLKPSLVHDFTR